MRLRAFIFLSFFSFLALGLQAAPVHEGRGSPLEDWCQARLKALEQELASVLDSPWLEQKRSGLHQWDRACRRDAWRELSLQLRALEEELEEVTLQTQRLWAEHGRELQRRWQELGRCLERHWQEFWEEPEPWIRERL
jgi:hypothetical protein